MIIFVRFLIDIYISGTSMRKRKIKREKMLNFELFEKLHESRTPEAVFIKNKDLVSKDSKPLERKDIDTIFEADPSVQKSYVNWLLQLYRNTDRKMFFEDLYKATDYLKFYDEAKKKNKIEDERSKNIFNIKTLAELFTIIEPFKEDESKLMSKKQLRGDSPVEGQYIIVHSDDNWDVVIPTTHPASCYWGSGTEWCTAIDAQPSYFNGYSKDGPLYIFRHKTDPKLRYQLHFESSQFKDKKDDEVSPLKLFKPFPYLKDVMAEFWKENPKFLQKSTKNPLGIVLDRDPKHEWGLFIEMIIDSGYDLNNVDSSGNTVLITLCKKLNTELVEYVCAKGANPSKANDKGFNALMAAIQATSYTMSSRLSAKEIDGLTLNCVEILFKYGADASGVNPNGAQSTVFEAILQNKIKTALFLVDKDGYDANATDNKSDSGRNLALYLPGLNISATGQDYSMTFEEARFFVDSLIKKGLDLNRASDSNFRNSPLHLLSHFAGLRTNDKEMVQKFVFLAKILLDNGANPWLEDNSKNMKVKLIGMEEKPTTNLLAIQKPIGKPKNPEMVALLTEYMKKANPRKKIPTVELA
jgi:hypothetical protein